jgi:hypothetical protein
MPLRDHRVDDRHPINQHVITLMFEGGGLP